MDERSMGLIEPNTICEKHYHSPASWGEPHIPKLANPGGLCPYCTIERLTAQLSELEISNGEKAEEIQRLTAAHDGEIAAHHRTLASWHGKVSEIERLTITCDRWKNDRQAFEQIAADHAREVVRLRAAMTELHQIADSGESDIRAIGKVIDRFPELRPAISAKESP